MRLISWNVNGLRSCLGKGFLDFCAFADLYGKGRTDRAAGETILHVYDFLRALPDYDKKLDEFLAPWQEENGFAATCWHDLLLAEAVRSAKAAGELFRAALADCPGDREQELADAEEKKTPSAKINLAEGEKKSRYHLCLPPPHGNGLTSACPRVGQHSCVCNARTRHSLLVVQPAAPGGISPAILHAPCTNRGLSGQNASGYLFPSSPFNESQFNTFPEACQSRVSRSAMPSISRALARESSVT